MKLYYSQTSPYARKVRLAIRAKGLLPQVEEIACDAFNPPDELRHANPLEKIPCLLLDDGDSLFDSPVICEYLDSFSDDMLLTPSTGQARWQVRKWEALCDGLMDSSYNLVMEHRRSKDERSQEWLQRWRLDILRVLGVINSRIGSLEEYPSMASLSLAAAIGYVELRLPDFIDKDTYPELLTWYEAEKRTPAMRETAAG